MKKTAMKKKAFALVLLAMSSLAWADGTNDAVIRGLLMQRDQAQRNADRERSYGHEREAYRWQRTVDQLQSQIDATQARGDAIDNLQRDLSRALNQPSELDGDMAVPLAR